MHLFKNLFCSCVFTLALAGCSGSSSNAGDPVAATPHTAVIKPSGFTQEELDSDLSSFYQEWKSTYLFQGCGDQRYLVDVAADGKAVGGGTAASTLTVSEAHGYGMLITVMMADFDVDAKDIFDGMVYFFHDHPAKSNPGLMAWNQLRTCSDAGSDVGGDNSATDGDMDIAYALLLADAKWGSNGTIDYKAEAEKVISAIKAHEIDSASHFVRIGDWVDTVDDGIYAHTTRSSDFMVSYFPTFADVTGDTSWDSVSDETYSIIHTIRSSFSPNTSLVPDFIVGLPSTPRPAAASFLEGENDGIYSWNAARYPWRIALDYLLNNDERAYEALTPLNKWIITTTGGDPELIADTYSLDGVPLVDGGLNTMAFVSMFAVSAMIDESNQDWLDALWQDIKATSLADEDYYGNTLKLLSMLTITGHWKQP